MKAVSRFVSRCFLGAKTYEFIDETSLYIERGGIKKTCNSISIALLTVKSLLSLWK